MKNTNPVTQVTTKELAQILFDFKSQKGMPIFASILQETKPKCTVKHRDTKEKNPYESIVKRSFVSILLNSDYETAVTNQLAKEGKEAEDYEKGKNTMPLTYGENNQFIGLYNGDFVLQYRPNDQINPKSTFYADGVETDKKDLADSFGKYPAPAENQGTEREIFWRKLYLKNVLELTFNKKVYQLIRD